MPQKKTQRKKGAGTLVMRGKKYFARWTVDGKIYTRTTETGDLKAATAKLAEFTAPFRMGSEARTLETMVARVQGVKAEIKAHEDAQPALKLASGWRAYREHPKRSKRAAPGTQDTYELQYNRFVSWMADTFPTVKEMRDVDAVHVGKFCGHLEKTVSANTCNKYVGLLKKMWETLADEARMTRNPWKGVEPMPLDTHGRRPLTTEETDRVFKCVHGEMRLLFFIGYFSGLRLGDAVRLKWDVTDMEARHFIVTPRKTARSAYSKKAGGVFLPMHPALWTVLSEYHTPGTTGFIMPELAGAYDRNPSAVTNKIQAVFHQCEIETNTRLEGRLNQAVTVGFHSLRYTAATEMMNHGTPTAVVQKLFGHSTPAMTARYHKLDQAAARLAIEALPSVHGTAIAPAILAPETLQGVIGELIQSHGWDAVQNAVQAAKTVG